jgi:hypothetical protein
MVGLAVCRGGVARLFVEVRGRWEGDET